jgi:hydrogenase maturation protease
MSLAGVLVVGYGNALRGDDGVGCRAAELLSADPRLIGARVESRHQLTPELAEDVAGAQLVVLIDAVEGETRPGEVRVERVGGRGQAHAFAGSHLVDAETIVELAERLYGGAAPVVLVRIATDRFEPSTELSKVVAAKLPVVVDTVTAVISDHFVGCGDDERPIGRLGTVPVLTPAEVVRSDVD